MMIDKIDCLNERSMRTIEQIQKILSGQFPTARVKDIQEIPDRLENPKFYGYQTSVLAARNNNNEVCGFAILLNFTQPHFSWLEYIAVAPGLNGTGIGSELYHQAQCETLKSEQKAIFFECCVDDAELIDNLITLSQNRARMKFYEKHGARPILHNDYPKPAFPGDQDLYYLMYDSLGKCEAPDKQLTQAVVARIMKLRYSDLYSDSAIRELCESFIDDPAILRSPQYDRITFSHVWKKPSEQLWL